MKAGAAYSTLLRLTFVAVFLSLGACATAPSAGIGSGETLPEDGGLVAVQVVTNSEKLSDALPNWSEVLVVDLDRTKPDGKHLMYSLPALNNGLSSTRVFVGILRPGRYRFAGLYAFAQVGNASSYQSARAPGTVGAFEIATDQMTNLGTVLFQPFPGDPMAKPMVGSDTHFAYAMSRLDDRVSLEDFVAHSYPAQYARTRGHATLGWLPDSLGPLRERLASVIRSRAVLTAAHRERLVATSTTPLAWARSTGAPRRGSGRRRICRPTTTSSRSPAFPMVRSSRAENAAPSGVHTISMASGMASN
ncbi:hypothetical protein [Dokdonella sp.]|uniref:hypothetical protein n=1 Tax=Dokdonella sp. TaxID=2291710 RepID=UPI002608008D|nr:hypothetical protein [Dokdonella sp.]